MKKMKAKRIVRTLGSLALIGSVALLALTGCKKKTGYAAFSPPQETSKCTIGSNYYEKTHPKFETCCNADTTPKSPMTDETCGSGTAPVLASIDGFTDANTRANFSNTVASALEAQRNPTSENNQLAATAGTNLAKPDGNSMVSSKGFGELNSANFNPVGSGSSLSRSGGGAGARDGAGAGNSTLGLSVNTQPGAKALTANIAANSENAAGGYTANGGGGRVGGSASTGSGFNLDGLFGTAAKDGAKPGDDISFGSRGLGSRGSGSRGVAEATMGTPDPDMYFAMMSREDNIFKAVERRYQSKAQQWALKDAKASVRK